MTIELTYTRITSPQESFFFFSKRQQCIEKSNVKNANSLRNAFIIRSAWKRIIVIFFFSFHVDLFDRNVRGVHKRLQ